LNSPNNFIRLVQEKQSKTSMEPRISRLLMALAVIFLSSCGGDSEVIDDTEEISLEGEWQGIRFGREIVGTTAVMGGGVIPSNFTTDVTMELTYGQNKTILFGNYDIFGGSSVDPFQGTGFVTFYLSSSLISSNNTIEKSIQIDSLELRELDEIPGCREWFVELEITNSPKIVIEGMTIVDTTKCGSYGVFNVELNMILKKSL